MKNILIIITLLFGLSLSAQTFDRVISYPGDDFGSIQTIEYESHYYFVVRYEENEKYKGILYRLDENGDVVDSLFLNGDYILPVLFNDYIFLLDYENKDSVNIIKINPNDLRVVDKKKIYPKFDLKVIFSSNYFDYCNCFTLVGRAVDSNGYRKSVVLQLDTQLNITKENYIRLLLGPFIDSSLENNYGSIYKALENPKGDGVWLLGQPMDTVLNMQGSTAGVTPFDSNLVRDSINHQLLRSDTKFEGGNSIYSWNITTEPSSGIRLTDTSYLFVGRAYTDRYDDDIEWWRLEDEMAFVITDNQLNDIRWEFWGGVDSAEISPTGEGASKHPDYKHAFIAYTSNFGFFAGLAYPYSLMKIDLEGNELWTRHYSIPWSYSVESVLATSDGGALMVGTMIDTAAIEKDIWIVKVDQWGNLNSTGVNEVEGKIDASNYLIYPNPAKNQLNLLKVNQFKPYEFELYDTFGRLVKTVSWREDHQLVDVSSLASGIYVYRIIDQEGNVGSGKLVVE